MTEHSIILRALVIDDDPVSRRLMDVMLGHEGLQVWLCENAKDGVAAIVDSPYDIIFIDINMPGMDGLTATGVIREIQCTSATTPIILISADVVRESRDVAILAGASDFLGKPVKVETLRSMLQLHLGN
jgi:CheY-like chemotaxis protein